MPTSDKISNRRGIVLLFIFFFSSLELIHIGEIIFVVCETIFYARVLVLHQQY